jgi:uncharacterized protein (DUF4415 family)
MKAATKPVEASKAAQPAQQSEEARRAVARRQEMLTAILPTAEEDAAITAAALTDPDNPPLVEGEGAQFKPARRPRGRPMQDATKVPTTMRLDSVVLDSFKATGDGWQPRINEALSECLATHKMLVHRYHATVHKREKETERLGEFLVMAVNDGQAKEKVKQYLIERGMPDLARGHVHTVDVGNARPANLEVIY